MNCKTCRWYQVVETLPEMKGVTKGHCYLKPPVVAFIPMDAPLARGGVAMAPASARPVVLSSDGCAEFAARIQA